MGHILPPMRFRVRNQSHLGRHSVAWKTLLGVLRNSDESERAWWGHGIILAVHPWIMNSANAATAGDSRMSFCTLVPEAGTQEDFCASWIAHQCDLIGGVKAAFVSTGVPNEGSYQVRASWPPDSSAEDLSASGDCALRERAALILQRKVRGSPGSVAQEYYDLAYPILLGDQLYGVVVLRLTSRPATALQSSLQQLSWGTAWLEVMLERERHSQTIAEKNRLQAVLEALAVALGEDRFHHAAAALVTDLARRFSCDRVSLGLRHGQNLRLEAISHSARFGKRSNLSRAIEAAMEEACDQETAICYPPSADRPYPLVRLHQELARRHGSTAICSVPLGREGEIYGALTWERLADNPFDEFTLEMCEAVAGFVGQILELKKREERPLRVRARDLCREHWAAAVGPGHAAIKLAGIIAAACALFFIFVHGQYRLSARTLIEAESQRAAVAPFNGYIAESRVRPGDAVRAGEILAVLDTRELKLEQLKWQSQKEQYAKQYNLAMAQQNASQVKITATQVAQAAAELALIDDHVARAQVVAPIDGIVVSGDLSQSVGAPAERGQVLYEIAPLNVYRVVLQVDERDAPEVSVGQRGKLALAAFPTKPLPFRVEKITPVSAAHDGRNYFRVEAALEQGPPHLRPGMEGIGKIDIGRRRLVWIWTHRAWDWLRLSFWSWAP